MGKSQGNFRIINSIDKRGMFITFEGVEGSGKSLQANLLYKTLLEQGREVLLFRDPGSTLISEQIRKVVLGLKNTNMDKTTELLLYIAARAQLVSEKIKPALNQKKIVICDRFTDSTYAYQIFGRGFDVKLVKNLNSFADRGAHPTLTFFLDMPVEVGLERREKTGKKDRLDFESKLFYERARGGYRKLIAAEPKRWVVINGKLKVEEVQEIILKEVAAQLNEGPFHSP